MLNDELARELHKKAMARLDSYLSGDNESPMAKTMQSVAVDAAIAVLWEYFDSHPQT